VRLLYAMAALWLALHLGVAGTPVRRVAVRVLGETAFRGAFSLAALLSLYLLAHAWGSAPTIEWWVAPRWLRLVLVLAMWPAFVLFVSAFGHGQGPPRGMRRVTRHPMLWSFALWGIVHVIGAGDQASGVFFGTFTLTALAGMPSIDRKQARRDPAGWAALSAATSILPFAAIRARRNRFVPTEGGWQMGLATLLWAALLVLHPALFGVGAL
jgi:uncharacterized membrane protein